MPREFVKNNEIVLNVSFDATSGLDMGNEWITFSARFGGVSRKIDVPVENVLAIYARENGQGMAFPVERSVPETQAATERENNPPPSWPRSAATARPPRKAAAMATATTIPTRPCPHRRQEACLEGGEVSQPSSQAARHAVEWRAAPHLPA